MSNPHHNLEVLRSLLGSMSVLVDEFTRNQRDGAQQQPPASHQSKWRFIFSPRRPKPGMIIVTGATDLTEASHLLEQCLFSIRKIHAHPHSGGQPPQTVPERADFDRDSRDGTAAMQ